MGCWVMDDLYEFLRRKIVLCAIFTFFTFDLVPFYHNTITRYSSYSSIKVVNDIQISG